MVAGGVFVWAGWVRPRGEPAPLRPGWTALVAGLIWPVLLVAVVQLAVVMVMAKWCSARGRQTAGAPVSGRRSSTPMR